MTNPYRSTGRRHQADFRKWKTKRTQAAQARPKLAPITDEADRKERAERHAEERFRTSGGYRILRRPSLLDGE